IIIGVGRGGSIIAGFLAGNLGFIPLSHLDTEISNNFGERSAVIRFELDIPVMQKKVLLVVGELYSGLDLKIAREYIINKQPKEIKTLSLFTQPTSIVQPDFYGIRTKHPVSAPWRISSTYKTGRL
ncbi:hypothetical protein MHK_002210, partial [Candidatus Magnetomorum sp. HK-1]